MINREPRKIQLHGTCKIYTFVWQLVNRNLVRNRGAGQIVERTARQSILQPEKTTPNPQELELKGHQAIPYIALSEPEMPAQFHLSRKFWQVLRKTHYPLV